MLAVDCDYMDMMATVGTAEIALPRALGSWRHELDRSVRAELLHDDTERFDLIRVSELVCTTTSSKQAQELVRPSYRWHAAHVSHSCAYYGVRLCLVQVIKPMASWLPAGKPAICLASGSVLLLLAPEQSRSRSIFVLLVGMVDVALLHGSMVYSMNDCA